MHGEAWLVSLGVLWKRRSGAFASNASDFVAAPGMPLSFAPGYQKVHRPVGESTRSAMPV